MLSFKHFRGREETSLEELTATYQRVIALLLNGTVVHAVRGEALDYKQLDEEISGLRDEITADGVSSADLLVKTGGTLKALQAYNRRTSDFHQAQTVELQKISVMLTAAIANLSVSGSTNVTRLHILEQDLEKISGVDDIRLLKQRLSECLTALREEKLRQQTTSEAAVNELLSGLHSVRSSSVQANPQPQLLPRASPALDSTTGLASRPSAELAIANASDGNRSTYAALFVIDHLHGLNSRYGRAVGDEVIMAVAQHLAQHLRSEDAVFRWSGPAFLALVERDEPMERVRRQLATIANARLEKTVESRDRTVLLPINFSWTVFAISIGGKAGATIDKLDAFVASKVGYEA